MKSRNYYEKKVILKYAVGKYVIVNQKYKGWLFNEKYGLTLYMNNNIAITFSLGEIREIVLWENKIVLPKTEYLILSQKPQKAHWRN